MKKGLSLLLSLVMCLALVVPTYAGNDEKNYFIKALTVTAAELKKESALVNKVDRSSEMLKNLIARYPYEALIEFGMDTEYEDMAMLDGLMAQMDAKADRFNKNYKTGLSFVMPKALTGTQKDMSFDMTLFSSPDSIAVNVPAVSDQYYQLRKDIDEEEWAESAIGQVLPLDEVSIGSLPALFSSIDSIGSSTSISADMMDPAYLTNLSKPYKELMTSFLNKGTYTNDGTALLDSNRGKLGVKKTTVRFTDEQIQAFLDSLGELVYNDKNLRSLFDSMYGSLSEAAGTDMTEMYISSLVSALEYIDVPEYLSYSIYTNTENKILRHEFSVPGYYEEKYTLSVDMVGTPYLLDEIYITVAEEADETISSVKFSAVGNYVPANRVFKTDMTMKAYESVKTAAGLQTQQVADLMKASYKLDMNQTEDNMELLIHIGRMERDSYSLESPYDINISILGDYAVDIPNKALICNLKDVRIQAGESVDATLLMHLGVTYRAIPSSEVSVPQDKLIDLTDLTEEEVEALGKKVEKVFSSLY